MSKTRLIFILVLISLVQVNGQVTGSSGLFQTLRKQDSIFFERSFNRCDFDYLKNAIHRDLVFYHDQGGIQNRKTFLENTKKNLCSNPDKKPIRKLESGSMEVFPLNENGVLYGAIQSGVHEFYIREPGKVDLLTSKARFTHVWLLKGNRWLLKEVLSFDHNVPAQ